MRRQLVETMGSVDVDHFRRVDRDLPVRIDRHEHGAQERLKSGNDVTSSAKPEPT
jgi:hypothetical protein